MGCDGIEQGEMGHLGKKYWVVWTMGWIWIEKDGLRHLRRIHGMALSRIEQNETGYSGKKQVNRAIYRMRWGSSE